MVELIITEKPAQAEKIAFALADKKPTKKLINKAPYYEITHKKKKIIVGCAVGHLFGLTESNKKGWTYPVYDIGWQPAYKIKKASAFSKPYVDALTRLSKEADEFTVATDYDIEGSVIGYNCVRFICKQKDARRMKFSTLTKKELVESYEQASPHLDFPMIHAGEVRHYMDYFWGISLSRALTLSVKSAGSFKLLSIGRVQGPALKIVVDKEKQIQAFKSELYWEIHLKKDDLHAEHKEGKINDKKQAESIASKAQGKDAIVMGLKENEIIVKPPAPFDLTTLQMEAYRCFGITPKETLTVAQELYTKGMISYPRTSSQKLPSSIGFKEILEKLAQQEKYEKYTKELLMQKKLQPSEGEKSDPAHPAIYPTGEKESIQERELKVYDLIVKRFLATFGTPAKRRSLTANIEVDKEPFIARGVRTTEPGWYNLYEPYVAAKEEELPALKEGQVIKRPSIEMQEKETTPPKRYTQASIIRELEKKNLGTKSTRASIVDALYTRQYLKENSIQATQLGLAIITTLEKFCPEIIDEKLTGHFEVEMAQLLEEKKKSEDVLEEAKTKLDAILKVFKKNEKQIGDGLLEATIQTRKEASTVGKCRECNQGDLVLRKGKFGQFIACNKYPDCKTTFSVPSNALIKPTEKLCERCNHHLVKVIRARRRPFDYCIGKDCPKKKEWVEKMRKKQDAADTPTEK